VSFKELFHSFFVVQSKSAMDFEILFVSTFYYFHLCCKVAEFYCSVVSLKAIKSAVAAYPKLGTPPWTLHFKR